MVDLIKLTEQESELLDKILPDDISITQVYKQPALENFRVESKVSNHTEQYTFMPAHKSELIDLPLADPAMALDANTSVVCTLKIFNSARKVVLRLDMWFGYDANYNFKGLTEAGSFYMLPIDMPESEIKDTYLMIAKWYYESIQYLLLHHDELLQFSVVNEPIKNSGKKKKGGKNKKSPPKKTRLYRLVHLTDEQTEELKKSIRDEHEKRKTERHCTAWGVRGHYRHYKSGKTAYIKPHVRGKEKESYQGREYVLLPKDILVPQSE